MKFILTILVLIATIFTTSQAADLGKDFVSGFETGIFLRGQPKMLKQYGCALPTKKEQNPQLSAVK